MPSRDQCLQCQSWLHVQACMHAPYCPKQSSIPQVGAVTQSGSRNACDMVISTLKVYPENSQKVTHGENTLKNIVLRCS